MQIRIKWQSNEYDGSEFFNNIEDATSYLESLDEFYNNEPDEDEDEDEYEDEDYKETRQKISLSKGTYESKEDLDKYIKMGYTITYEGVTGWTLEKIYDIKDTFSLSKNEYNAPNLLKDYLSKGYEIIYEGKTGYTLEKSLI